MGLSRKLLINVFVFLFAITSSLVWALGFSSVSHDIYSRDNGDVYLKAKPKIVILAFEISIPLLLSPDSEDVLLIRQSDGSYVLDYDPTVLALGTGWEEARHNILFGDFNSDGYGDLLLQAKDSGVQSVVLEGGNKSNGPVLTQNIDSSTLGVDITESTGVTISLTGNELLIKKPGMLDMVSIVGSNGVFSVAEIADYIPPIPDDTNPNDEVAVAASTVGVTSGAVNVTPSGALTYSVPINVPPGVNGLTPNLALNYNSQGGNGLLGKGGSLSGLSLIHRCSSIYAIDNESRGISFSDEDALCLNGNRLIKVNDEAHFTDGAEYRTEIDSFTKVTLNRSSNNITFEVRYKNGRIHSHNKQINSVDREVNVGQFWPVSKVEDRFSNSINFSYLEFPNGQYVPDSISYGNAEVEFSYNDGQRTDSVARYLSGAKRTQEKYLTKITTKTDREWAYRPVLQYNFIYLDEEGNRYDELTGNLHLQGVQECGFDKNGLNSECKAMTELNWPSLSSGYVSGSQQSISPVRTQTLTIDWNGDGLRDLLVVGDEDIYVHLANQAGNMAPQTSIYNFAGKDVYSLVVTDIEGDGTEDLIFRTVTRTKTKTTTTDGVTTKIVTEQTSAQQWMILLNHASIATAISSPFSVDGPTITTNQNNTTIGYVSGELGWESGSSPMPVMLDVDGDGKPESLLPVGNTWKLKKNNSSIGHISLDQRTTLPFNVEASPAISILGRGVGGDIQLLAHKESSFDQFSIKSSFEVSNLTSTGIASEKAILADVNGDGLQDIISKDEDENEGDKVRLHFYTGEKFLLTTTDINAEGIFPDYEGSLSYKNYPTKVFDYNNDGLQDLIYESEGKLNCLPSNGRGFNAAFDTNVGFYAVENGNPPSFTDGGSGPSACEANIRIFEQQALTAQQQLNELIDEFDIRISSSWATIDPNTGAVIGATIPASSQARFDKSLIQSGLVSVDRDSPSGYNYTKIDQVIIAINNVGYSFQTLRDLSLQCSGCSANVDEIDASITALNLSATVLGIFMNNPELKRGTAAIALIAFLANELTVALTCEDVDFEDVYIARVLGKGAQDYQLADFNGDGWADIAHLTSRTSNRFIVDRSQNTEQEVVTSIVNGQSVTSSVNYLPITSDLVYQESSSATSFPNRDIRFPMNVVQSLTTQETHSASAPSRTMSYVYQGAKLHLQGRGFLGFEQNTVTDSATNLVTTTKFKQEFPFIGRVAESQQAQGSSGSALVNVVNTWKSDIATTSNSDVQFPYIKTKLAKRFETNGVEVAEVTTVNSFDTYGNLTDRTETTKRKGTGEQTVTTSNEIDLNGSNNDVEEWLISFVDSSTVTTSTPNNGLNVEDRDTAAKTITVSNTALSGTLNIETEERFDAGHVLYLKKHYTYDLYGNLLNTETSGNQVVTRTNKVLDYIESIYPERIGHDQFGSDERTLSYDLRFGAVTRDIGFDGLEIKTKYDEFGRAIERTAPDGTISEISYDFCTESNTCPQVGGVKAFYKITTVNPGAPTVVNYFDAYSRQIITDTQGFETGKETRQSVRYNDRGLVQFSSLPYFKGAVAESLIPYIEYEYDIQGRVVSEKKPDGGSLETSYSTSGDYQQVVVIDRALQPDGSPFNRITATKLNSLGQVVEKKEGYGRIDVVITQYDYDAHGNLDWIQVDNSELETTTTKFDALGNRLQLKDPDLGTITSTYDALGNILDSTDNKNQKTQYIYDKLDRQVTRIDPPLSGSGSGKVTTWLYDKDAGCALANGSINFNYNGKLCGVSLDDEFVEQYAYSSTGNLVSTETRMMSDNKGSDGKPLMKTYLMQQNYDQYSRLASKIYPSNLKVSYSYNSNNYLEKIFNAGQERSTYWEATEADAFGNVTSFDLGNGLTSTYSYEASSGRLDRIVTSNGTTDLQNLKYTWFTNGNMASRTWDHKEATSRTETFSYDYLNRLLTSTGIRDKEKTYSYFPNGNIRTATGIAGEYSYGNGSNAGPHALISAGSNSYQYDGNGNMTLRNGKAIKYTVFDKPYEIHSSGDTSYFRYGADRLRYYQKTGNKITYYLNGGSFEEVIDGNSTTYKTYIGDFLIHEQTGGAEKLSYLHRDALGSTDLITDVNGEILQELSFEPFGGRRDGDGSISSRGFTDHEHLDESGLIHMNGRVYDPLVGRFLSADPFVQAPYLSQSYNRYSYVWNNPLSATDPSGYLGIFGHYDMTYSALIFAGFPHERALAVAEASWAPDVDTRNAMSGISLLQALVRQSGNQELIHLLDGKDPEAAKNFFGAITQEILLTTVSMTDNEFDSFKFSTIQQNSLHSNGDAQVHINGDGMHYSPFWGHLVDSLAGMVGLGIDPDNPYQNRQEHIDTFLMMYDFGVNACQGFDTCTTPKFDRDAAQNLIEGWVEIEDDDLRNYYYQPFMEAVTDEKYVKGQDGHGLLGTGI